ncbi:protein rep [Aureispira sp. CCB-E]|uniref:protein rep n=1 Tax=Aureispira sp. CCB-E TaxID=3051121 RepID=UPI00286915C6|nr:protein rep [Aureispira sp. CCB-E]WMX12292.1 protein rep [Aureispira sp. CCB-E]
MCNKSRNINKKEVATSRNDGGNLSALDKLDTSVHFSPDYYGSKANRDGFLKVNYRIKNLDIVSALKTTTLANDPAIEKVCKGLSCCSTMSIVEVHKGNNTASIHKTSHKCKRRLCAICARIRANKYRTRFINAYQDPENRHLFKGKYFYFFTLSLKHNTTTVRTGVYLDEFKKNMRKLRRSKLWEFYFPYSKNEPESGYAQSYELTLTENGYNIHSHILMCCPPMKRSFKHIEKDFQEKWLEITGDSKGFRIDKRKISKEDLEDAMHGNDNPKFVKIIAETFKYTVKVGNPKRLKDTENAERLANWIVHTKGKNLITANGFFKGMQLFGQSSKYDNEAPETEEKYYDKNYKYYLGKTAHLKFNYSVTKNYTTKVRQHILHFVALTGMSYDFIDITDHVEDFDRFMGMTLEDKDYIFLVDLFVNVGGFEQQREYHNNSINDCSKQLLLWQNHRTEIESPPNQFS